LAREQRRLAAILAADVVGKPMPFGEIDQTFSLLKRMLG
jgi:hypothetical protein